MIKKMSDKRLIDYYSKLFMTVLEIDEALKQGKEAEHDCPTALQNIKDALKIAERDAKANGKLSEDVELCSFAYCAWADEYFAKNAEWSRGYTPLQVTFFHTRNAGNEFYEKFERLREDQEEVREVYYIALGLGFLGENYNDAGPAGKIQNLMDQNSLLLPVAPTKYSEIEAKKIISQPYETPDPKPRHSYWKWVKLILLMLLLLGIAGYLYYYFFLKADKERILREARKILNPVECSSFKPSVDDDFKLIIDGYLGSESLLPDLNKQLRDIYGVSALENRSSIYPKPLCEMANILEDYSTQSEGKQGQPRIRPTHKALFFREGDKLTLAAATPDKKTYVYVDYIQKDGFVVHLLPVTRFPDNLFEPSQEILLGAGQGPNQPVFVIKPPFGKDMVVIYTSNEPLFNFVRPEVETTDHYFKALKAAFEILREKNPDAEILSDYYIISTSK